MPGAGTVTGLEDCERWFVRRGVPHFIQDHDAREDIWTRSLPVLVVLYVLRGLYALDLDEGPAINLLLLALVLVVLVATWSLTNLLRRRPHPHVIVSWSLGGRDLAITEPLLRVAGFLATFAGLSFTVYLVTDPTYREEFRTDVASEVREAIAVRAAYRSCLP